jgi:hypothetical protein
MYKIKTLIMLAMVVLVYMNLQAKDQKQIQLKPEPGLMTQTIQKAIDSCAGNGGGTVILTPGNYLSGGIELKSKVTLQMEKGSLLQGSDNYADYRNDAFIYGKDLSDVTIQGEGTIDGVNCINKRGEEGFRGPHCIRLINCKNISLEGFTIINSANWAINCRYCSFGKVDKVFIRGGHDGLHTRFCDNFTVTNCDFRTGDDAIAGNDNQNFVFERCKINSSCNGFRFGCFNLLVSDCHIWGPGESEHKISKRKNMLAAFVHFSPSDENPKLKSGNWLIKNVTVENADVFYLYNYNDGLWQTGQPATNIRFENINATGLLTAFSIQGKNNDTFQLTVKQSFFAARNDGSNPIGLFEGKKLSSSSFFNASHFHTISLDNVEFINPGLPPTVSCTYGEEFSSRKLIFTPDSKANQMELLEIRKINNNQ